MSRLHLISHSFETQTLAQKAECYLEKDDSVLLIADGVLMGLQQPLVQLLLDTSDNCYLLDQDCRCRGISPLLDKQPNGGRLKLISYETMVDLCARSEQVISW